ncbi:DNA primase/polymerase [Streptomyces phage RosaAsantewaa]|nr:DNA primase/polymerase [Streptomyces phage RosaAsantewaa]
MDFFRINTQEKKGVVEVRPDFVVGRSKDLMVRGGAFYAIWDEEKGLWSTDEYDVQRIVDEEIDKYVEKQKADGIACNAKHLSSNGNGGWKQFKQFCKNLSDNYHQLDMKLTFQNTEIKKTDYASRRLPYSLALGDISAWDELTSFLYTDEERAKIEWSIGSIISGDSKKIEKFLVFYGPGGTGKSTILKIIQKLFEGYTAMFEAKALVGNNNSFSTEAFKDNPLVAIQHDGDLSKIEDNSKLNSVVGHDIMRINEKYKAGYEMKLSAFLYMGTNKPVRITDAKSGLIRRLIDVKPTGKKFEPDHYYALMQRIDFELGAIAQHCLDVYRSMGKNYYNGYQPLEMMLQTDVFFNYIEAHYDIFKEEDGVTMKRAWELYKEYCREAELEYKLPMYKFREELKNYFEGFHDRIMIDGVVHRSYYKTFTARPFKEPAKPPTKPPTYSLVMDENESIFDEENAGLLAQYGTASETPKAKWDNVKTLLGDLDTSKLHFVKVPEHHIVIDFDLKGDDGEKSLEANLKAASSWPPTYAEVSKGGAGVHLHYIFDGDTSELASEYSPGIEIKVYRGGASLRRKLTKCNNIAVATLTGGLPFREKKPMLESSTLQSEKGLRDLIVRNLRKEIHPTTKPSIDFIEHILDEAYKKKEFAYDVSDMRSRIMAFANNSSNQAMACLKAVARMQFKSEIDSEEVEGTKAEEKTDDIVIFDCEVYPNLFVVCWKIKGQDTSMVRMINPKPAEVEGLLRFKLIGFNNRKYDNHILYARAMMGYNNQKLFQLSQRIINNDNNAMFGEAYNLSYADIYDFSSKKQGLKKWEIELGLPHVEMDIPWDQDVPDDMVDKVVEYCCNDVNATEAVLDHCEQDFAARKILAGMSGLPVNATTRKHTERIIFGNDREPQKKAVYTDLSEMFPGYKFDEFNIAEKSTYRGEVVGEGGYVYAEPGMYEDVALLDVASMHPTSLLELNLFGPYTPQFQRLVDARLAIKHGDFKKADELLPGVTVNEDNAKALSDALKLVINSVYGFTSATFPNPFKDPRNKDNIVAKRGALFMIDLKHAVQEQGFTVAHIKTDSIKIPNATPDIIAFVTEFGAKYGYTFEHEGTYKKFCLVNDAVYIAKEDDHWTATGAQFKHPYVFKKLFSGENLTFSDLCETKQVKSPWAMYLDYDKGLATPNEPTAGMDFIGRTGLFVPVVNDGAELVKLKEGAGKPYAVAGTKGYKWVESEMLKTLRPDLLERMIFERDEDAIEGTGSIWDVVDMAYYSDLAHDAIAAIEEFGSFEEFVK